MNRPGLIAATLVLTLLVSGCWSRREINDLGIVVGLGIDLTEAGLLEVTMSVAHAGASPGGRGEQGRSAGGGGSKVILKREGKTIAEAIRRAELTSPRRLVLHHVQVIIFGERLAEKGMDTLLDYLLRSPQVRLNNRLLLVREASPEEVLATDPLMGTLQSHALRELESRRAGVLVRLRDFFIARASGYQAPLVPVVRLRPHPTKESGAAEREAELDGAGIFSGDRVATYLTREEVRGVNWLRGQARDAIVTTTCLKDGNEHISARVTRAHFAIIPILNGSRLSFKVRLSGQLSITDVQCPLNLADPATLAQVESKLQAEIRERVSRAIEKAKTVPADPFDFGETVRAKLPRMWDTVGKRWPEVWAKTPVDVTADLTITELELTSQTATGSQ